MTTLTRALALSLAIALPALPGWAQQDTPAAPAASKPVKLMEVESGTAPPTRHFFGKVVARQTVDLAFQVGGEITDFDVAEGQFVEEGELIASLDMELFQLQFEQARLQLEQADRTLERLTKLAGNTVSQVTIDDAETAKLLAEIALRQAEYNLEHAMLLAPFDGMIALRHTEKFNTTGAGAPVVRLLDISEVRVEIDVPEVLFQQTGEDDALAILARFPAQPDKQYPMTLREFDAQASEAGQSFRVTLGMDRADDLEVLPGSSVEISVSLFSDAQDITLPSTALLPVGGNGDLAVMLFEPGATPDEGSVTLHPVKVEVNHLGGFTVVEGLSGGEQVVATGVAALKDGQAVRRFTGFAR
ncbi:efflux RND transporter periplasmic adaptor subunit [Aliiroseovarius sp.]|uniref:efflux RND transporter periplasmic adaptor subunit n=1 Tax=Aliiroseovarius sp. TaxID=1872442 RepID=UPI00263708B4|nr:efflux RND transporter periplasmic adaptor subunit [Aliiroseovarius sp.]